MKKYIVAAAAVICAMSSPVVAEDKFDCSVIGDLAAAIMTGRQQNVPMSEMMGVVDQISNEKGKEAAGPMVRAMVIEAYSVGRYETPSIVNDTIMDFRNRMEGMCFQVSVAK